MFGSILLAYFLLKIFLTHEFAFLLPVAILSILLMSVSAIMGIFEDDLKKYLIYSNVIQLTFILLDLTIAKLSGKLSTLGTIQIFNYTFAGLLFFLTLGILSEDNKKKKISSLQGSYYKDKLNGAFAVIASLSLAGVPGLNIFVSEWFLFKASFLINPIITVLCIFLTLLLFIMYFKVANVLLIGSFEGKKIPMRYITFVNASLAAVCLTFGLLPQVQLFILGKVL
jgi:multicomponent Na+:H+ antiporter subunit D